MKTAKLIIDGKEIEIQINEEQLEQLCPQKKKTGYERVNIHEGYYRLITNDCIVPTTELDNDSDDKSYELCNYYSSRQVAENNARADRLMRQLRRFAVEHREKELGWGNKNQRKWYIAYNYYNNSISLDWTQGRKIYGVIYFDSGLSAELAIDTFKDELLWYFKEYKDSL